MQTTSPTLSQALNTTTPTVSTPSSTANAAETDSNMWEDTQTVDLLPKIRGPLSNEECINFLSNVRRTLPGNSPQTYLDLSNN